MESHALFPGTFDPPTLGHLDVVRRAAALFGRVTVGLADHPTKAGVKAGKDGWLPVEERLDLLRECTAGIGGVEVVRIEGLVVDAAEELGATCIVRGVRSGTDFDYEVEMARTNRMLARIDTCFLASSPETVHVTATLVRQIAGLGRDVSAMVPGPVAALLRERFPPL
ncbi:MAG: pantetheine-phosphate adenylyltransferase [Planctomycetota bacterium]|nr:pantetheine-phosphate adenylyltransferase [Planctomycetota bacterium]